MIQRISRRNNWFLAAALLILGSTCLSPQAWADSNRMAARQLPDLAEAGQFTELLTHLRNDYPGVQLTNVEGLIQDLERYHANEAERTTARRKAYDEALTKVDARLQENKLEEALVAAIEAHGLADDAKTLLATSNVQGLVERAEQAARTAEENSDWVEALSLYRLLELLIDDRATYREPVNQARRHVRVLQIYAPDQLEALYEARRARLSPEEAKEEDPVPVEKIAWQVRLKDISPQILQDTLLRAVQLHISGTNYTALMRGAVDGLLVLVRTEVLAETFPGLADPKAADEFRGYLERLSASLKAPNKKLSAADASAVVDRIMLMNDRTTKLPTSVLVYEMTQGATETLDEFSAVIWPRELELFSRSTEGTFTGVGIRISRNKGQLTVESPLLGTPAYQAGIKPGDIIAEVDGQDTSTWSLDKAVDEITGLEGTIVTLSIKRDDNPELIKYPIRRTSIAIESILGWEHSAAGDWNYLIDADNRIGYVRLSQFLPQTAGDLDAAIDKMQQQGPLNGLILDLRFNPGGLLKAAIQVADRFIDQGPIVSTVDAKGNRTHEHRARRFHTYQPFPLVILINQGSASASEIVAGALQDHSRALIVGTRSFGKGSVQDVLALEGGQAALKLTTQHYMLPLGRIIHRQPEDTVWGIEPDLVVEMTTQQIADALELRQDVDVLRDKADLAPDAEMPRAEDLLTKGLDPQLETALLVLKTKLVAQSIAMAQANR